MLTVVEVRMQSSALPCLFSLRPVNERAALAVVLDRCGEGGGGEAE
jgi:hypothetical protein